MGRVGPRSDPWPLTLEGQARSPELWPDPGPHRVGPGQPTGQQGLALPVDSVGIAECANHTLSDGARARLDESKLPKYLWAEAVNHHVWIRN